jgi:uncharacterized membrane protein
MSNQAEVVVNQYMDRLQWRLAALPQDRREEILAEVREHIDESLASGEEAAAVIERLGDPAEIGDEAAPLNFGVSPQQGDGAGDKYMRRYMRHLRWRLSFFSPDQREEVLAEVQGKIDAALPADGSATLENAQVLIERLGSPSEVAADAYERFGILSWRYFAYMAVFGTISGLWLYFGGGVLLGSGVLLGLLPFTMIGPFDLQIRRASKRVQVSVFLLTALLSFFIFWVVTGSLPKALRLIATIGGLQLVFWFLARRKPPRPSADIPVNRYMRRLKRRLRGLPREEREEILAGVREHIDESLPKDGSATREDARTLIGRLGGPTEIADDAAQRLRDTSR